MKRGMIFIDGSNIFYDWKKVMIRNRCKYCSRNAETCLSGEDMMAGDIGCRGKAKNTTI
ncbi:MAG: hypothetical protein HFG72_04110 [Hungatella sp.]|jgi:hypothetical protein|nr:hypothetical protein [Hungatella sp.]